MKQIAPLLSSRPFPFRPLVENLSFAVLAAFCSVLAWGQGVPVTVEAEDATAGADYSQQTVAGSVAMVISTDATAGNPVSSARVLTFSLTFPEAGEYQLYARLYVGEGGGNDDSFFYGNGFGEKDVASNDDWILVNQLSAGIGSTNTEDYVPGEEAAGSEVWKWVFLSGYNGGESPISFTVPTGQLTQTFQVGAREDGLALDKFVFGRDGYYYTVGNLENGEAGSQTTPSEPFTPTGPPIATGKWKWLGNIYSGNQLEGFTAYWNQVTPENAGKWESVESTRDVMNWGGLDAAYDLAKQNGFKFRFHILIWGAQQPSWINDLPPEEQLEEIEEWMRLVSERYPDIDYLEVVNEPLHQPPDGNDSGVVAGRADYIDALGGRGDTGWEWVMNSFRLARKYFGDTPLVINDYGIIDNPTNVQRYLEIVDLLMEEDLVDVISFQAHAFSTRTSAANMQANLDTLASRGLPIMITEMDVDGATDISQLSDYKRIFPVFWDHPSVIGVTLWGFRPGLWRNDEKAYLVLNNGAERPAMVWLQEYVAASQFPDFYGYLEERDLDPDLHGFLKDADGDSLSTGFEYVLGTDPEAPNTLPLDFEAMAGINELSLPFSSNVRDGKLEIQKSEDLMDWETVAWFDLLTGKESRLSISEETGSSLLLYQTQTGEAGQFYRIRYSR